MVSFSAARQGKFDLLVGDIIGSNIFNVFAVVGVTGLIAALPVPEVVTALILPFTIATIILYWIVSLDQKIVKAEGLLMILIYLLFLGKLFAFI